MIAAGPEDYRKGPGLPFQRESLGITSTQGTKFTPQIGHPPLFEIDNIGSGRSSTFFLPDLPWRGSGLIEFLGVGYLRNLSRIRLIKLAHPYMRTSESLGRDEVGHELRRNGIEILP